MLIVLEVALVLALVFGWGLNELRQLKKYKHKSTQARADVVAKADLKDSLKSIGHKSVSVNQQTDSSTQ